MREWDSDSQQVEASSSSRNINFKRKDRDFNSNFGLRIASHQEDFTRSRKVKL